MNDKLGKIYRERPMKEQQLIEKREIAIELEPDGHLEIKDYSVYVRVWDAGQWSLSQKMEFVLSKSVTMRQFASSIRQKMCL